MTVNFVSGFESIIDQQQPIQLLTTLLKKGTVPHALLFTGTEGVGKRTAAMAFAMACNCSAGKQAAPGQAVEAPAESPNPPVEGLCCGVCKSCRKIQSNNHPDVLHIQPSGSIIKIAQIRGLCRTLSLKPYEARVRVVIVSQAQTMNLEAANAFLKVLEEPPASTLLILTAEQTADLLPTIVSRCQPVRFNPISRDSLALYLTRNRKLSEDRARLVAAMAGGSITKAMAMSRTDWIGRRDWLLAASGLDVPGSLSAKPVNVLLAFAEILFKGRENLPDTLDIIKSWLRDLVVWRFTPEKIINLDLREKIQRASREISTASLLKKINAVQRAQREIEANANLRLSLEVMVLRLADKH